MKEVKARETIRVAQRVTIAGLLLGAISGTAWSVRASNFGSSGLAGNDYTPVITLAGTWLTDNTDFKVAYVGDANLKPTCTVTGCSTTYAAGVQAALGTGTTTPPPTLSSMGTFPSHLVPVVQVNPPGGCTDATHDACVTAASFTLNGVKTGLCGWTQCLGTTTGTHPNQKCSLDFIRFDIEGSRTCGTARSLACHEFGHSVGLKHTNDEFGNPVFGIPQDDCMMTGQQNARRPGYNAHNIGHLSTSY